MTRPVRLQLRRQKGFALQALSRGVNGLPARKVDRSTRFGNPISCPWPYGCPRSALYEPDDRRCCVDVFRHWLETGLKGQSSSTGYLGLALDALAGYPMRARLIEALPELRGKNLACWCALDRPCHADALLELANGDPR